MNSRQQQIISYSLSGICGFLALFCFLDVWRIRVSDDFCSKRDISWAPLGDDVIPHTWKMFPELTLFTTSEAFGRPTPDIERYWGTYLPDHPVAIPKKRLQDLSLPLHEPYAHPPRNYDSVLAIPEVFVQLQCLNLLRQHLAHVKYGVEYSHLQTFHGDDDVVMHRADLCIERLRSALLCWSDLGTILQPLVEEPGKSPRSLMDFGTLHKCRNIDNLREWTTKNGIRAIRMDEAWFGGRVFE